MSNLEQEGTRSRIFITYKNERLSLGEWCERLEVPYYVLYQRVVRAGWSVEDSLETPYEPLAHKEYG